MLYMSNKHQQPFRFFTSHSVSVVHLRRVHVLCAHSSERVQISECFIRTPRGIACCQLFSELALEQGDVNCVAYLRQKRFLQLLARRGIFFIQTTRTVLCRNTCSHRKIFNIYRSASAFFSLEAHLSIVLENGGRTAPT